MDKLSKKKHLYEDKTYIVDWCDDKVWERRSPLQVAKDIISIQKEKHKYWKELKKRPPAHHNWWSPQRVIRLYCVGAVNEELLFGRNFYDMLQKIEFKCQLHGRKISTKLIITDKRTNKTMPFNHYDDWLYEEDKEI